MQHVLFPGLFLIICSVFWWATPSEKQGWAETDSVADILQLLGEEPPNHVPNLSIEGVSVARGKALFQTGVADRPEGGQTAKQSRHFVCTSCHNTVREDPDLAISDPQARLEYAQENGLPYLPGTTLYGAVNRSQFYNGDYEKKYGDLVRPARNNLREAIQLCAVECSQGRPLEDWEMESVLAYLWTIDLQMGDLKLNEAESESLGRALAGAASKKQAVELIRSKYLPGSPATFITPPEDRKVGYPGVEGDPNNGQLIYELSCLHCHAPGRYAFFELDNSRFSFSYLEKHMDRYTRYSIYQVARYGTSPLNGRRTYMPNYTLEKMSNQQLEDLRAYIESRVGK
jgi:mono/diheme cytochrome c family protein